MTKTDLLARIAAHETEGESITAAMAELGITAKDVKALRKAQIAAEKARAALAEMMGAVEGPAPETEAEKKD